MAKTDNFGKYTKIDDMTTNLAIVGTDTWAALCHPTDRWDS